MNRAQKNAWFGLGFCLIADFLILIILGICFSRSFQTFQVVFGGCGLAFLSLIILLISSRIIRKEKSDHPVQADERDRIIRIKAIVYSFVSVWLLIIFIKTFIVMNIGFLGEIPALIYLFADVAVFLFALTIYYAVVIMMYRLQERPISNHG